MWKLKSKIGVSLNKICWGLAKANPQGRWKFSIRDNVFCRSCPPTTYLHSLQTIKNIRHFPFSKRQNLPQIQIPYKMLHGVLSLYLSHLILTVQLASDLFLSTLESFAAGILISSCFCVERQAGPRRCCCGGRYWWSSSWSVSSHDAASSTSIGAPPTKRPPPTMAIMAPPNQQLMAPNLLIMARATFRLLLLPIAMLTGLLHIIKTMLFPLRCLL